MSPQEQRVAIAEACGWKKEGSLWICPVTKRGWATDYPPPNYVNDLNAMHEAETFLFSLGRDYRLRYRDELIKISEEIGTDTFHLSAKDRAKAFLLSLGKWKKSETAT